MPEQGDMLLLPERMAAGLQSGAPKPGSAVVLCSCAALQPWLGQRLRLYTLSGVSRESLWAKEVGEG